MTRSRAHILLTALIACVGCDAVSTSRVGFKGVYLGDTQATVREKFPNAICRYVEVYGFEGKERPLCVDGRNTIAEVPAEITFLISDIRVVEIWAAFSSDRFDTVVAALMEQNGKPTNDDVLPRGRQVTWDKASGEAIRAYEMYFDLNGDDKNRSLVKFMPSLVGEDSNAVKRRSRDM